MLLMLLGPCLIVVGILGLRSQNKVLESLRRASGTLVGYVKDDSTKRLHALVRFSHNLDKHFFKNSTPFEYPEHAIGSEHTVYYEAPAVPEVFGTPLKATLRHSEKSANTPHICIGVGLFSLLLFSELTGFYFVMAVTLVALYFYFSRTRNALSMPQEHIKENKEYLIKYPLSETFEEEKLSKFKLLELSALNYSRDDWHSQQRFKGFFLVAFAIACFIGTDFSAFNPPETVKIVEKRKKPSISDIIDAGSIAGATNTLGDAKEFVNKYCFSFHSNSCYVSHKALDEEETGKLYNRFWAFLLLNAALISLAFALICLFSKQIFAKHDAIAVIKKATE
jgi:hypothetical protein